MGYLLLHFGQSNLFIPFVLFGIFQRLAESGDGLLEFLLISVDLLHIGRSKLLVLQLHLQCVPLMLQRRQVTDCEKNEERAGL